MTEGTREELPRFPALLPVGAALGADDLLGLRAWRFGVPGLPAGSADRGPRRGPRHAPARAFLGEEQKRRPAVSSHARTTAGWSASSASWSRRSGLCATRRNRCGRRRSARLPDVLTMGELRRLLVQPLVGVCLTTSWLGRCRAEWWRPLGDV